MSGFHADTLETLEIIARAVQHGESGSISDNEYSQIIAADKINRILRETEYTPPKRGRSRKRKRGRPRFVISENNEEAPTI